MVTAIACVDDDGPVGPGPGARFAYGALITPRVSYEIDSLLVDAYQSITGDDYQVAHTAISWSEIAVAATVRIWRSLDLHVQQARSDGVRLSVVLEFMHGGEADIPGYIEDHGWGWEDPTFLWEMERFLGELAIRSQETIDYLWLGEGPDRYAIRHPDEEERLVPFFAALAEIAREKFPNARIGVLVNVAELERSGKVDLIRAIRDSVGAVALSVYPEEIDGELTTPEAALTTLDQSVMPWVDAPFAIVETGYPSDSGSGLSFEDQSQFATVLADWLRGQPSTLRLFCWSPVHDARADLADSLAGRRYPFDSQARERYSSILSRTSLRRLDGARKPAREVFRELRP